MDLAKKHDMEPSSNACLCAHQKSGSVTAIHTMRNFKKQEKTEDVTLVVAANAFSSINGAVLFHNIEILCSFVFTYFCFDILGCFL